MRNYGRFTTSIYRDRDFRSLTVAEQGVYYLLGLQPEVTAAGTLPLTLRRWSDMSAGMTKDALLTMLETLQERDHILMDEDTEELLIVKFIKWDGGIGNEKRRPVIAEAASAIASESIRQRVAYEIERLGYLDMASKLRPDTASDAISGFDRVVVTEGEYVPQPQSTTLGREPSSVADAGPPSSPFCAAHPNGTEKPCGPCGTAKLRYMRWEKSAPGRKQRAAAVAAAAREACPLCDPDGWVLAGDGAPTARRCDHMARVAG